MSYETIKVEALTRAIGARVEGIDLSRALESETVEEIRRALHTHLVLFFEDQRLSPEQQSTFAGHFGRAEVHEVFPSVEDFPHVSILEHNREHPPFSDTWHSDVTYRPEPSMASILYARTLPPVGGDTLWRSAYAAYETLSEPVRELLRGLNAEHDFVHAYGAFFLKQENGAEKVRRAQEEVPPVIHPVVVTHPVTGRDLLYVNPTFTRRLVGLSSLESRSLLDMLFAHLNKPEFQVRFRWSRGALAIWDNRATQHYATGDYYPETRLMHRVTVGGTVPELAARG